MIFTDKFCALIILAKRCC